jgi:hypothetical protein
MSSRVDSAIPTRLPSIRKELIGKKLRVVGKYVPNRANIHFHKSRGSHYFPPPTFCPRVLSYDVRSSTILLWDNGHVVLVDISLCLPEKGGASWLRDSRSTVTLLGYLERSQVTFHACWCIHIPLGKTHEGWVGEGPPPCPPGRNALTGPSSSPTYSP